jgi:hypothetical protein
MCAEEEEVSSSLFTFMYYFRAGLRYWVTYVALRSFPTRTKDVECQPGYDHHEEKIDGQANQQTEVHLIIALIHFVTLSSLL